MCFRTYGELDTLRELRGMVDSIAMAGGDNDQLEQMCSPSRFILLGPRLNERAHPTSNLLPQTMCTRRTENFTHFCQERSSWPFTLPSHIKRSIHEGRLDAIRETRILPLLEIFLRSSRNTFLPPTFPDFITPSHFHRRLHAWVYRADP